MGSNPTYSASFYMLRPSQTEIDARNSILAAISETVRAGKPVKLPAMDHNLSIGGETAFATVGLEPNPYGAWLGDFRYQFEGEEDLLHLIVTRRDQSLLSPEEAQQVASFALPGVPSALIWLKPGTITQHFYLGHDDLLAVLP